MKTSARCCGAGSRPARPDGARPVEHPLVRDAALLVTRDTPRRELLAGGRLDALALAGALHDPLAALLFCQVPQVDLNVVQGRVLVREGQAATLELPRLVEQHNRLAAQLAG